MASIRSDFVAPVMSIAMAFLLPVPATGQDCRMERVSLDPTGGGANGYSFSPVLSWDGRIVAFYSEASNLVPGDTNANPDIFVRDRVAGTTARVSVSGAGGQSNGWSAVPSVSGDGRFVTFRSIATNLDPRDPDPGPDIYLHDRVTGATVLVSERTSPGSSSEGAWHSALSKDGRFVVFDGVDDNFAPGDNNHRPDVFVKDILTGAIEIVSVGNQGEQGNAVSAEPAISADGRFVAFASRSSNWFPGNAKQQSNVYVRDRLMGTTTLVSHVPAGGYSPWGGGGEPSISADGDRIAFMYQGQTLMPWLGDLRKPYWQTFTYSMSAAKPEFVSSTYFGRVSNAFNYYPEIAGNGRYVAWESYASDLVPHPGDGNQDIFLRDMLTGVTVQVSRGMNGEAPNGYSVGPAINFDGTVVAFASKASNLVPGDVGNMVDIFVWECDVASPTAYCEGTQGAGGCAPALSFQGKPSATAGSGFELRGDHLVGAQPTIVLYSLAGSQAHSLLGGLMCMDPPIRRTPPLWARGTPLACDGTASLDMNAWIASGQDPRLMAGAVVHAQLWCRDPIGPEGALLANAVAFVIEP